MCGVMDDDVVGVIVARPYAVGNQQTEPPKTYPELTHPISNRGLQRYDRARNQSGVRIPLHQSSDFRMRFEDRTLPCRMGLSLFRLEKKFPHDAEISFLT